MKLAFVLAFLAVAYALPKPEPEVEPAPDMSIIDFRPLIVPRHFITDDIGVNVVNLGDLETPEVLPLGSIPASSDLTIPNTKDLFFNDISSVVIAESPVEGENIVEDDVASKVFDIIPTEIKIVDAPIDIPNEQLYVLDINPTYEETIAVIKSNFDSVSQDKDVNLDFINENSFKSSQDTVRVADVSLPEPPKSIEAFKIPQVEYPGILYKDPTLR